MKKSIALLTLLLFLIQANGSDDINQYRRDTDALWRRGVGAEDGAYTAISLSMLGWGLGLAAGIGVLASVLHQSTAGHSHSSGHCCD
jgi:hypothetical protein